MMRQTLSEPTEALGTRMFQGTAGYPEPGGTPY